MEVGLAIWGAVLSTLLFAREAFRWKAERPRLIVSCAIARFSVSEDGDTDPRLVLEEDERGWSVGVAVRVQVANSGERSIQLVSIYIEHELNENQVIPSRLPVVLEPKTRVDFILQPEWFAEPEIVSVGVLDALGRKHALPQDTLQRLMASVDQIATRIERYRRKENADSRLDDTVTAFQAFDHAVLVAKTTSERTATVQP